MEKWQSIYIKTTLGLLETECLCLSVSENAYVED